MRAAKAAFAALALLGVATAAGLVPAGTAARSASAQPSAEVRVRDFEFVPRELTVKAGTAVTWTNDGGSHTVTSDAGAFSSPTLTRGKTFSHRFTRPGAYRYHCAFHGGAGSGMSGTVVVTR
ncbi:MAG TPA: plastocyanin/azurin family copper-binding protein [Pyrinomonadaceae bacterium]|nr:plastocyanin/azurin family copper-binding protein [Pyrinomonadaceae bacterium]